jgi:hypothetical protein
MAGRNSGERAEDDTGNDYDDPDNNADATLQSNFGIPLASLAGLPNVTSNDKGNDTNNEQSGHFSLLFKVFLLYLGLHPSLPSQNMLCISEQ